MNNYQERQFSRTLVRPKGNVEGGAPMTNRQESRFAPPEAARKGGAQGGAP